MRRTVKRFFMVTGFLGLWIFLVQSTYLANVIAQDFPAKPIDFIINYSAGGSTDLACRAFINAANKHLPQPLIPINKPGGGGAVSAMAIMTAKPDGYTIGSITPAIAFVTPFSEEAPFKDLSGFSWIVNFGSYVYPLMVRADAPWKNWNEFIEWARKNPRAAKIGSTQAKKSDTKGLILWQIEKRENVEFTFLVFKGGSDIYTALLGGHINMSTASGDATLMSYVKEGKFRFLAFMGPHKVPGYEGLPCTSELKGFEVPDLLAIVGPKGIPDYIVKKLEDVFAKAVKDPDFIEVMSRLHMPVMYMDRATLMKHVEKTFSNFSKIYERVKAE